MGNLMIFFFVISKKLICVSVVSWFDEFFLFTVRHPTQTDQTGIMYGPSSFRGVQEAELK